MESRGNPTPGQKDTWDKQLLREGELTYPSDELPGIIHTSNIKQTQQYLCNIYSVYM